MQFLEHKIPPPVLLVIGIATEYLLARVVLHIAPASTTQQLIAAIIALCALLLLATAFITFHRAGTTIDPVKIDRASTIVRHGIFGLTRNPMYLALVLMATAGAVYFGAWINGIVPVALLAYLWRFQIVPEERVLTAKFGNDYLEYIRTVRRWI